MKRVRLTIHPQETDTPWLYDHLTAAEYITDVETVNWNNATAPAGFLLWIRGDYQRLEAELSEASGVSDYEILPLSETECHCFVAGDGTADARALWANFNRGSLLTVPPVAWNSDGSSTFVLVGTEADIQAAIEGVPPAVSVDVDRVGGEAVRPERVRGRLSDRQRTAVSAAVSLGYYETPRRATLEDVAAAIDSAPSTAGEHLQRAEAKLLTALFD